MKPIKFQSQFHKELIYLLQKHYTLETPPDDMLSALVDAHIRFFMSLVCTDEKRKTIVNEVAKFMIEQVERKNKINLH